MQQSHSVPSSLSLCLAVALLVATTVRAPSAAACSCVVIARASAPARPWGFLVDQSAQVPSNFVGLPWSGPKTGPEDFSVERVEGAVAVAVPFRIEEVRPPLYAIVPTVRPLPGQTYRFTTQRAARGRVGVEPSAVDPRAARQSVDITVVDKALALQPSDLALQVSDPVLGGLTVPGARGACSMGVYSAQRTIRVVLPPHLERFRHLMTFETTVDGRSWQPRGSLCQFVPWGRSWVDVGAERLFVACPWSSVTPSATPQRPEGRGATPALASMQPHGLVPGEHQVEMRVQVHGLVAAPKEFTLSAPVELSCGS